MDQKAMAIMVKLTLEQLVSGLEVTVSRVKQRDILPILRGELTRGVIVETLGIVPSLGRALEVFDLYQRGRQQNDKSMLWALDELLARARLLLVEQHQRHAEVGIGLLRKVGHVIPDRVLQTSNGPAVSFDKPAPAPASKAEVVAAAAQLAERQGTKAYVGQGSRDANVAGRFVNLNARVNRPFRKLGDWQKSEDARLLAGAVALAGPKAA